MKFASVPKIMLEVFRIINIITPDLKSILHIKLQQFGFKTSKILASNIMSFFEIMSNGFYEK